MALIICSCFSVGILSSMVTREMKTINTFEELIDSNLSIISANNSYIYWGLTYQKSNIKFRQLEPKIKFIDDWGNEVSF